MGLSPWDMFVMDQIAKEDRNRTIARHLAENYSGDIGNEEFEEACRECGLDILEFEQSDIDEIQKLLNRM